MRFLRLLLLAVVLDVRATPPEVFARLYDAPPRRVGAISPDGSSLVYLERTPRGVTAHVVQVDTGKTNVRIEFKAETYAPAVRWLTEKRFVAELDSGIVACDADGKDIMWLADTGKGAWKRMLGVRIVARPPTEPDYVYIEGHPGAGGRAVYKVHLTTGAAQRMQEQSESGAILYDRQGRMRIWHSNAEIPEQCFYRAAEVKDDAWRPLDKLAGTADTCPFALAPESVFKPRSVPIAFGADPNILYIASNFGRQTFGIYGLDVRTGQRTGFAVEDPVFDLIPPLGSLANVLIFDPVEQTLVGVRNRHVKSGIRWLDPDIARVQARLEALLPSENVLIENWDLGRRRFHLHLTSRTRPLINAVYSREPERLVRFEADAPPGPPSRIHASPWAFKRADDTLLTGSLLLPDEPAEKPLPIVACFRNEEWDGVPTPYAPEPVALAQMGFAVLEVNHRGVSGLGLDHWLAGRTDPERVAGDDLFAAIDRIAPAAGLDSTKVALYGQRFGGFLALRIAQLHADRVTAVVAGDPIVDAESVNGRPIGVSKAVWQLYAGDRLKHWREHSPLEQAPAWRGRVMLVALNDHDRGPITRLRKKLESQGNSPRVVDVIRQEIYPLRFARAWVSIEEFLNEVLLTPAPHR